MNRVTVHLVGTFEARELAGLKRDELQDLLDAKAQSVAECSFSKFHYPN